MLHTLGVLEPRIGSSTLVLAGSLRKLVEQGLGVGPVVLTQRHSGLLRGTLS